MTTDRHVPKSTTQENNPSASLSTRTRARIEQLKTSVRELTARHLTLARALAAVALALAIIFGWFVYEVLTGLPGRQELRNLADTTELTTIYDARDQRIYTIPTQHRIEMPLERISKHLTKAMIAVEDVRFYEHEGIDGIRVIGAVLADIRQGRAAEGASTLTQQLARLSFLSRDKTLRRKVKEAVLAQRIEKLYSKDEILEFYLNKVYFGDGLYGAEAAAQGYFGKPASDLTLAEGALLAGLVKAPSASNPTVNLERAVERRDLVLKLMLDNKLIDRAAYDEATSSPVTLRDSLRRQDPSGVHFKELVRRQLVELFGREKVYEGRLKVYVTVDPEMQKAAEQAVLMSVREIEARGARRAADNPLQAALLAIDVASGEVRAIVGGRDIDSVGLNRATQAKRQPGSAFKPFVYAAALESGYSPSSVIDRLNTPIDTYEGAWLPEDEHSTAASMTIRTALRTSSNRAAVRMLEDIGLHRAVEYATQLGVGTVPNVPSLALGSGEVTLMSMTSAYGAFAQGGIVREPIFIRRVEDQEGAILFEAKPKQRRAISETTAFLMTSMLADVVDAGTANRARVLGFTLPAAGKTGTTNDFVDAWFVGFTPRIVAGVWVGFDKPRTIVPRGFAGQLAVPLWARFMKAATRNDGKMWFEPPPGVVAVQVCRVSGNLPVAGCRNAASIDRYGEVTYKSMVYTEYFQQGREPHRTCAAHAVQALPYPEPYFTATDFENIGDALDVESAPLPVDPPASIYAPPPPPGTVTPPPPRRLPDLPAAPPETRPEPPEPPPAQSPSSALPPPEAPERPPAPPPQP
jgi:1A family penicillin-binding protein